jgi:hypothetical protein
LTVEALVVGRSDRRPDELWGVNPRLVAVDSLLALRRQPAGWAMVLRAQALLPPPMPDRRYGDLKRVNPFLGGVPSQWDFGAAARAKQKRRPDERPNVYLVLTDHANQQIILLNETKPDKPSTVNLGVIGRSTFEVWNGKEPMKGRLLRVEPRDVYFQVGREIYTMHIGQNLAEAMRRSLSPRELKELGLAGKMVS